MHGSRQRSRRAGLFLLGVVAQAAGAARSPAVEVALVTGQLARLRAGGGELKAVVQFRGGPIAPPLTDPTCPARSTLRLAVSADDDVEIDLPCANWRRTERGYRYVDPEATPGGVRRIILGPDRLVMRLHGAPFGPAAVPVSFVELGLAVDASELCGRFSRFTRNAGGEARAVGPSEPCSTPRPNFLIVMLDDLRADGIDRMPVLQDRFAPDAVRFVNSFVPNSLCCPSRASSLTGLYAVRHGSRNIVPPLGGAGVFRESGADRETLAVWLQGAGYRTGLFGKYLNGYVAESHAGPDGGYYVPPGWDRWRAFAPEHYGGVHGGTYSVVDESGATTTYADHTSDAEYSTDLSAAELRTFVAGAVADGVPFFAYWAPYAPHGETPQLVPAPADRHVDHFAFLAPWRPPSYNEQDVSDKPLWTQDSHRRIGIDNVFIWALIDLTRRRQYETLLAVDEQLEQILDQLAALGAERDTVVIVTSDNGLGWGEHQMWGTKDCPYEECTRVPLAIRYPRRAVAGERSAAVLNLDIPPTLAELAGVEVPLALDGMSLGEILRGGSPASRREGKTGWRSDFLLEHWRQERSTTLVYSTQPSDGDQVSLLHGDVRARPRAALLYEFDGGGGVSAGAEPIAIGADADATFANLRAALAGAGTWTATHNAATNRLNVNPGDAIDDAPFFRVETAQGDAFEAIVMKPDYFGLRDVANGMIWVEYESGERELYDLASDPHQLESRHDDPAFAAERQRLEGRLEELLDEIESRSP